MPLPKIAVLDSFVNAYLKDRESNQHILASTYQAFTGRESKEEICQSIKEKYKKITQAQEWIDFIEELGNLARKEQTKQNQARIGAKYSNLSLALHAIRTFALAELAKDSTCSALLGKARTDLQSQIKQIDEVISNMEDKPSSEEKIILHKNKLILKLADLGDDKAIVKANELFGSWEYPQTNNESKENSSPIPICYSSTYYLLYFDHFVKPHLMLGVITFDKFITATEDSSSLQITVQPPSTALNQLATENKNENKSEGEKDHKKSSSRRHSNDKNGKKQKTGFFAQKPNEGMNTTIPSEKISCEA